MMVRKLARKYIKVLIFCLIGAELLLLIQSVLTPEWKYPLFNEAPADTMEEFYKLIDKDKTHIQAVFVGPSHTELAIDPMYIYENSKIVTYNLSTSAQPFEASYYLVKEMLERTCGDVPEIVMVDPVALFRDEIGPQIDSRYRYILDNMKNGTTKLDFAQAYASSVEQNESKRKYRFLSSFLPILNYHNRWSQLLKADYQVLESGNYYRKGFFLTSTISAAPCDVDTMNKYEDTLRSQTEWQYCYDNHEINTIESDDIKYKPSIAEQNLEYLLKMRKLCQNSGSRLILIKIPALNFPQYYSGSWTKLKSSIVKQNASDIGLEFCDLLYDVDLGIDWTTDTNDGGYHLNFLASQKVSKFIADYLQNECNIVGYDCKPYDDDIPIYNKIIKASKLQTTLQLTDYLKELSLLDDVSVFISVSDDLYGSLTDSIRTLLNDFGLSSNFDLRFKQSAYLAIKEHNKVIYETFANHKISKDGTLTNGISYHMTSSGFLSVAESVITINGKNYSMNRRGINIVTCDNKTGKVLDSVNFDTCVSANPIAFRNNSLTESILRDYEHCLMLDDAKMGLGL